MTNNDNTSLDEEIVLNSYNLFPKISHLSSLAPGGSKMRDPGNEVDAVY